MSACLTLSALQVLKCEIGFSPDGRLKINSPGVPLSGSFLSLIKQHKEEITFLSKLRCPDCKAQSVCEEGKSYLTVYCPNGCDYTEIDTKSNHTEQEALADWQQIKDEAEERLALMTENGRDETDVLNELCQQVIVDLFTEQETKTGVAA